MSCELNDTAKFTYHNVSVSARYAKAQLDCISDYFPHLAFHQQEVTGLQTMPTVEVRQHSLG
jgi:hypothetical protein